ncbi:hypothetical protein [Roseovarius aestuariivivens]|uniref:hypothetical protein n=1 Tax=Roseovarius aestuariivivens TaxID=1888910 RepID=UPI0010810DE3|nr:hypothetical protein [Roseovarius aestuariivivens]
MKKHLIGLSTFATTTIMAGAVMAQGVVPKPVRVPEISALEGGAALAALAAIVLLAWERRRRAS